METKEKKLEVYCMEKPDNDDGNIWRAHWLKAVADIRSEMRISVEEAEELLRKSSIDNRIELKEVDYWVEK